jgi:hypothetical protein
MLIFLRMEERMEYTNKMSSRWLELAVLQSFGLAVVYFLPALVHLLQWPVYYLEPMRILVILALVHSSRSNALILALTLPIFSYFISAHPVLLKAALISGELVINVLLFDLLRKNIKPQAVAIFGAILGSKLLYYFAKYIFIKSALISSGLISTPLYWQLITSVIFTIYAWAILDKKSGVFNIKSQNRP